MAVLISGEVLLYVSLLSLHISSTDGSHVILPVMLITIHRVALTSESELPSCQMLSSLFSVSPLAWGDPSSMTRLLLRDCAAVRCLVSPQSPGDREQMKQVRGPRCKTGSTKRHYYYTVRDKWLLSQT